MSGRGWVAGLVSAAVATLTVVVMSAGCSGGTSGTQTDSGTDGTTNQCGASGTLCSGSCVNTQTDNANCGSCGTACGAGEVCSQGKCATSCGGGTKLCGSICADTKNDPQNCGDCSTKCTTGQVCSNGNCGTTCTTGQTFCGGDSGAPYCANTKTDNANCGGCGTTCGTGQVCNNGTCANSCGGDDAGTDTLCTPDGGTPYCANTKTDNANCGGCGITCGNGKVCQNGACANDCASSDGGVETLCTPDAGAPYCANTSNDSANCGSCGNACPTNYACLNGQCNHVYTVVGSYDVNSGVVWSTNPNTYTCQEACAAVFGGNSQDYACSTSATTLDHTAWESCWGDGGHCNGGGTAVADNAKVNSTYDCGATDCSCSAYVQDWCTDGTSINYCWK